MLGPFESFCGTKGSKQSALRGRGFLQSLCVCAGVILFFFQPLRLSYICGVDEKGRGQKVAVSHLIAILCVFGVFAMFYQRGAKLFCPGFREPARAYSSHDVWLRECGVSTVCTLRCGVKWKKPIDVVLTQPALPEGSFHIYSASLSLLTHITGLCCMTSCKSDAGAQLLLKKCSIDVEL